MVTKNQHEPIVGNAALGVPRTELTYSLIDPQIVTVSESTALKEVFKRLIEEGLNEENKNIF